MEEKECGETRRRGEARKEGVRWRSEGGSKNMERRVRQKQRRWEGKREAIRGERTWTGERERGRVEKGIEEREDGPLQWRGASGQLMSRVFSSGEEER